MCLICERIELIKQGKNPHFVKELETGYVVIGDGQYFKGYTLFLAKEHVTELHQMEYETKIKFLEEMSIVQEAVAKAFQAEKMNIELLGNGDAHVHWHLFPRKAGDMKGMAIMEEALSGGFHGKKCHLKNINQKRMTCFN